MSDAVLRLADAELVIDPSGALWWERERMLIVADLHLEKGSSLAARGVPLPPYDTAETLGLLAHVADKYAPRIIVSLGDGFHDRRAGERVSAADRERIAALQTGRDWIWVAGNHDPDPVPGIGGVWAQELAAGLLKLRHEPAARDAEGEIAGHLHPVAQLRLRGQGVRRRCMIANASRAIMPAFGAFAGGLSVRDPVFAALLGAGGVRAWLLGRDRVYRIGVTVLAG